MAPQVTVIIPAYRRRNYLFYALDRILAQKDVTMEILVFSEVMETDEVDEVEKAYPQVKYFKTDMYKGASSKRRAGIKMAQGKYLYMPDDDDYLTDDSFFSQCVKLLDHHSDIAFVAGLTDVIYEYADSCNNYVEHRALPFTGRISGVDYLQGIQVTMSKPMSTVSTFFRKEIFEKRKVDEMYEISDVCLYLNALLCGDVYVLNKTVAVYRFHEKNLTFSLPYWFMYNVLREKERVYIDACKLLPHPHVFWYNHYRITYLFYKDGKATFKGKLKMLGWGMEHLHSTYSLFKFIVKEFIKVIIGR